MSHSIPTFNPWIDDAESIELGISKQIPKDDLYMPSHLSRGWIRCYVVVSNSSFRMYREKSHKFLLSAKQYTDDTFYVSTYEDFPSHTDSDTPIKRGYVATITRQRQATFIVSLNHCKLCDYKLGKFTCGRGPDEREVIAKVTYSTRKFTSVDVDIRCVQVSLPAVIANGERVIWCPRSLRYINPAISNSSDMCEAVSLTPAVQLACVNKLPEWSVEHESLVLKFQGNRILSASTRNFLLFEKVKQKDNTTEDLSYDNESVYSGRTRTESIGSTDSNLTMGATTNFKVLKPKITKKSEKHPDVALLQFGKSTANNYVLDYQYPLSPLQAFGIALTTFASNDDKKTNKMLKNDNDLPLSAPTPSINSSSTASDTSILKAYFTPTTPANRKKQL